MQLFELQQHLKNTQEVLFYFEEGKTVAPHYHITELAWMEKLWEYTAKRRLLAATAAPCPRL